MPRPSVDPREGDTFPALCSHTHLFPGSRCRMQGLPDPRGFAAAPRPVGVDLRFSDGAAADAELLLPAGTGPALGSALLAVPAYTTTAGTKITARTWQIRELRCAGDEVELTLGSRTPD